MAKTAPVPVAEFIRKFGIYRMMAQRNPVPVSSHGQITGYFIGAEDFEELEKLRTQRRSFSTRDLREDTVQAIAETQMDPRHDHLNALLDRE
jgi:hypothetical protein